MNIYALKDILIDYFMVPFAAPGDKEVLSAIAKTINGGQNNEDIQTAPHQFQVWRLAKITDDGHVIEDRYLVADCSSLIRAGVRDQPGAAAREVREATPGRSRQAGGAYADAGTEQRTAEGAMATAPRTPHNAPTPPNGANPGDP